GEPRAGEGVERLAARHHRRFQLEGRVEMILERAFAAAGDEDHLLDPGLARLLYRILDERLVDDRKHLLRHRLGGGQDARPQAGDGEDGLADGLHLSGASWLLVAPSPSTGMSPGGRSKRSSSRSSERRSNSSTRPGRAT